MPEKLKKSGKKVLKNYGKCLKVAGYPLYASIGLLTAKGERDVASMMEPFIRAIGAVALIPAVVATPFTVAAGAIGAVANTVYATGSLPIAVGKDIKNFVVEHSHNASSVSENKNQVRSRERHPASWEDEKPSRPHMRSDYSSRFFNPPPSAPFSNEHEATFLRKYLELQQNGQLVEGDLFETIPGAHVTLSQLITEARQSDGQARQVFVHLGWMDSEANLRLDAPEPIKTAYHGGAMPSANEIDEPRVRPFGRSRRS